MFVSHINSSAPLWRKNLPLCLGGDRKAFLTRPHSPPSLCGRLSPLSQASSSSPGASAPPFCTICAPPENFGAGSPHHSWLDTPKRFRPVFHTVCHLLTHNRFSFPLGFSSALCNPPLPGPFSSRNAPPFLHTPSRVGPPLVSSGAHQAVVHYFPAVSPAIPPSGTAPTFLGGFTPFFFTTPFALGQTNTSLLYSPFSRCPSCEKSVPSSGDLAGAPSSQIAVRATLSSPPI